MMPVTKHYLCDFVAHIFDQIFTRHAPIALLVENGLDTLQYHFRVGTAKHIAATFDCLWALCDITYSHIRHSENATFFLHGAAVAEHTKSITFQCNEI
jgi:hypothetical protein